LEVETTFGGFGFVGAIFPNFAVTTAEMDDGSTITKGVL
jgi:hypothetical protein